MRRILKRPPNAHDYIRQAVQAGTYRTAEEIRLMKQDIANGGWMGDEAGPSERRQRLDFVRGTSITDYPAEYIILQQHPPFPAPLHNSRKVQKLRKKQQGNGVTGQNAIKHLTKKYYERNASRFHLQDVDNREHEAHAAEEYGTDWYYRDLLGIPKPHFDNDFGGGGGTASSAKNSTSATAGAHVLSQKSTAVQAAYQAAVLHYQFQRTSEEAKHMTQEEIMAQVDDLLQQSKRQQTAIVQAQAAVVQQWRQDHHAEYQYGAQENIVSISDKYYDKYTADSEEEEEDTEEDGPTAKQNPNKVQGKPSTTTTTPQQDKDDTEEEDDDGSTLVNQLYNNPRTWQALQIWSDRLQRVPYASWTIGAATALDHWIATTILHMDEDTWQALLGGQNSPDMTTLGASIVATRQALFPETTVDPRTSSPYPSQEEEEAEYEQGLHDDEEEKTEKEEDASALAAANGNNEEDEDESEVDDLLARLESMIDYDDTDDDEKDKEKNAMTGNGGNGTTPEDTTNTSSTEGVPLTRHERFLVMARELQDWRKQYHHQKQQYKQQANNSNDNMDSFDDDAFYGWSRRFMEILGVDKNSISYEDFREALLQDEPLEEDISNQFWDTLTEATSPEDIDFSHVSSNVIAVAQRYGIVVTRGTTTQDLWNLAALRPLLDEYYPIDERDAFLTKYGDILLEGIPLEHLKVLNDPSSTTGAAMQAAGVPVLSLPAPWSSRLPTTARIHLQNLAYRRTVDDDLYALWKEHKAGRARYEEKLFRTKRLGLVYGQPFDEDKDEDND
jgi:hypothetical protein